MSETVREWQKEIGGYSKQHGWHEEYEMWQRMGEDGFRPTLSFIMEKLMLAVSELSEAGEELRTAQNMEDVRRVWAGEEGKPEGFGIEVTDAIIRLLDLMEMLQIDTQPLLGMKMDFNVTRSYKHGKQL